MERFEFRSGAPGDSISRDELEFELSGKEWTMDELYGNRDPRFHASVFYPEAPWNGGVTYFHSGTYVGGELFDAGTAPNGRPYKAHERNTTKTGFMVKKRHRRLFPPAALLFYDSGLTGRGMEAKAPSKLRITLSATT